VQWCSPEVTVQQVAAGRGEVGQELGTSRCQREFNGPPIAGHHLPMDQAATHQSVCGLAGGGVADSQNGRQVSYPMPPHSADVIEQLELSQGNPGAAAFPPKPLRSHFLKQGYEGTGTAQQITDTDRNCFPYHGLARYPAGITPKPSIGKGARRYPKMLCEEKWSGQARFAWLAAEFYCTHSLRLCAHLRRRRSAMNCTTAFDETFITHCRARVPELAALVALFSRRQIHEEPPKGGIFPAEAGEYPPFNAAGPRMLN
jgi:hypothetical protein